MSDSNADTDPSTPPENGRLDSSPTPASESHPHDDPSDSGIRPCAVVFGRGRGISQRALAAVREHITDVIAVCPGYSERSQTGDASGEPTASAAGGVDIVDPGEGVGVGGEWVAGLTRAASRGFTHAITIGGDVYARAKAIPVMLDAVRNHPLALIVGHRNFSHTIMARIKQLWRLNIRFWTWLESGMDIADPRSGCRAYPLDSVLKLHIAVRNDNADSELLVKAAWAGIDIRYTPIMESDDPDGGRGVFRAAWEGVLALGMHSRLLLLKMLLPVALLKQMDAEHYRTGTRLSRFRRLAGMVMLSDAQNPAKFGACVGVGIMAGILPIWGLQMALAIYLAHRFRLNKVITLTASNISLTALLPIILYASVVLGRLAVRGVWELSFGPDAGDPEGFVAYLFREALLEYTVGAVILACLSGLASGLLAAGIAKTVKSIRKKRTPTVS